ncbi:AMP-binding protein [Thermopetrobacter sp. TC1]|uniref:AMP-binding protein n=1 Tax=Thermopetrobacter sp. TC1 TaxID=1495045 RepID=UPI00056EAAF9|nr:AMP-binding protein [Thermopetrobacter sp. TC1]
MSNHLFDALFAQGVDETRPFITVSDGKGGDARTLSFSDIRRMSLRMARALARMGARPGDRICVQVRKSPEALALYLACLAGGYVFQPLNMAYTAEEVRYFVRDAKPRILIVDPERKEALTDLAEETGAKLLTLRGDWRGSFFMLQMVQPENFEPVACDAQAPAAMLYTSGTTGRPKGAVLSHGNLLSNARDLVSVWDFTENDVLIHALPIHHAHGLFVAINVPLLSGARLIWHERFDANAIVADLPRASVLMGVPTFYARLLKTPAHRLRRAAANMRLFISGSAPLSPALHAAFEEATGHAIVERYGMTETGMIASLPLNGARKPGSVGFALPSVSLRIVDRETGEPLPQGETGMVEVKGPNVFSGYWQQPEKTDEAFREDGWFITGDLGRIDDQGYLHLVGRAKDLIITGGLNVYPAEVEAVLDSLPGVAEAAVVGIPDAEWGEKVCAIVAPDGSRRLDEKGLIAALKERLAGYKVPKRVVFVDALPRNAMGKVMKDSLRDMLLS